MNGYSASFDKPTTWLWLRRIGGYFALARISNSPTVISNVVAGAALAGAFSIENITPLVSIMLAMVAFYTAGMYLNDLCDYDYDRVKRPERPLASGLISRSSAMTVTVALFVTGSLLLLSVGLRPFVAGFALIALIIMYDAWHKTNPLSPVLMAGTRVMVYIVTFLAFSQDLFVPLLIVSGLLMSYMIGLTSIAKSENNGSFTRYWPVVALFLPTIYFAFNLFNPAVLGMLLLFTVWGIYSISFIYRRQQRDIGGAIARLIAGISLFDSVVIAATGYALFCLVAIFTFGLTRYLHRYVKGT